MPVTNLGLTLPATVTLTPYELLAASSVGCMRQIAAIKRGLDNRHGLEAGKDWQVHVEGACGEMAFAKWLGVHWDGTINTFRRQGDVGRFEVKTRSRHDYDLIVRDDDHDDAVFWLLTGVAPTYTVRGWLRGKDAKQPHWRRDYGGRSPAYFVPQTELKTDLKEIGSERDATA